MEKYIHQYLTNTYYLKQDSLGRHWIYTQKDPNSNFGIRDNILLDLKNIYGLEVVESKLIIYRWAIKFDEDVNLDYFWFYEEPKYEKYIKNTSTNFETATFPMAQRVLSRTIGQDLVMVQPLAMPTGLLQYFGVPNMEPKKLTKYENFKGVLNKIIIFIRKHLVLPNKYNTFVTQKK